MKGYELAEALYRKVVSRDKHHCAGCSHHRTLTPEFKASRIKSRRVRTIIPRIEVTDIDKMSQTEHSQAENLP